MPIGVLLERDAAAFDPEEIKLIVAAFEDACRELHVPQGDRRRDKIAFRIFACVQTGERNPARLRRVGVGMTAKPPILNDPDRWAKRAEGMRSAAEQFTDQEAKATMFRIAGEYDQLAERAKQRRKVDNAMQASKARPRRSRYIIAAPAGHEAGLRPALACSPQSRSPYGRSASIAKRL